MTELQYLNLTEDYARQCEELELLSFPETEPADLIGEEDYRAYARIFPDGFFLCLDSTALDRGDHWRAPVRKSRP
ncbi:MAG: hypothetical protein JRG96_20230 [Deltaproteobacteria bacterium]|nr:hypothetical protein [Deltaproteobacteria bacterium]